MKKFSDYLRENYSLYENVSSNYKTLIKNLENVSKNAKKLITDIETICERHYAGNSLYSFNRISDFYNNLYYASGIAHEIAQELKKTDDLSITDANKLNTKIEGLNYYLNVDRIVKSLNKEINFCPTDSDIEGIFKIRLVTKNDVIKEVKTKLLKMKKLVADAKVNPTLAQTGVDVYADVIDNVNDAIKNIDDTIAKVRDYMKRKYGMSGGMGALPEYESNLLKIKDICNYAIRTMQKADSGLDPKDVKQITKSFKSCITLAKSRKLINSIDEFLNADKPKALGIYNNYEDNKSFLRTEINLYRIAQNLDTALYLLGKVNA